VGRFLGAAFSFLPTKERRVAQLQLDNFLAAAGGRKIVARVYAGLGQSLLESINLAPILQNPDLFIECPDLAEIRRLLSRNKPIVALTAHTGNWDLLAAYIVSLGIPLTAAGRAARIRAFQEILAEIRSKYGVQTIWRAERGGGKALLRSLQNQRVVAALIDQDTQVASVFAPFFGVPVKTPSGLISLGKKIRALFVSAFMFRSARNRYRLYIEEIDGSLPVQTIAAVFNQRLEKLLRRYPDQWVWMHKRWRSSPDHGTMSTDQYCRFLEERLRHANL